jgi:hypothetical protein
MALVNLQTDLTSLKFGKDRPGGGSSGQPYIEKPLNLDLPPALDFLGNDFLLRGGPVGAPLATANDIARLTKYFTDFKNPSGLLFIAKKNLLSRTAVKTQTSGLINEGIYTPLSTLAQVGVSAFGLHVNKQGLNPFEETGAYATNNENLYAVKINQEKLDFINGAPDYIAQNRLYGLYATKIVNIDGSSPFYLKNSISLNPNNLLTYPGGPGSDLGIGNTNIRFADQRTGINSFNTPAGTFSQQIQIGEGTALIKTDYSVFKNSPENFQVKLNYNNGLGLSKLNQSPVWINLNRDTENIFKDLISFTSTEAGTGYSEVDGDPLTLYNSNYTIGNSIGENEAKKYLTSPDHEQNDLNYNNGLGLSIYPDSNFTSILSQSSYTGINNIGQLNRLEGNVTIGNINNINPKTYLADNIETDRTDLPVGPKPKITNNNKGKVTGSYVNLPINPIVPNPINDKVYTYTQKDIESITSDNLGSIDSTLIGQTGITTPGDFRQRFRTTNNQLATQTIGNLTNSPSYLSQNIETRINLGDPGNRNGKNLTSYVVGADRGAASFDSYDKVNALPIYRSDTPDTTYGKDLIKFRIGVINNDNPSQKTYIHFRALLNQISDQYTSNWDSTQYIGRGEKFYTYNGFERKYSLSWTVAAQSKAELIPMYKKLNYLASVCAPDYGTLGYMRGNIVTLTVGGYLFEQPGIITGFSYEMNDENSTWEIGIDSNTQANLDTTVKELPHIIKVTGFNFIPIHTFVPKLQFVEFNPEGDVLTDNNVYGPERYIALKDDNGDTNYGPPPLPSPDPSPSPLPQPPLPPPPPTPIPVPEEIREDLTARRDNTLVVKTLKYPLPPKNFLD